MVRHFEPKSAHRAMTNPMTPEDPTRRQIMEEIEQLRRELSDRRASSRPAPRSIVNAYHELLARQYERLDCDSGR